MRLLFISKGSTKTGLGHVIRSTTLATEAFRQQYQVESVIIGEHQVVSFFAGKAPFHCTIIDRESLIWPHINEHYDAIIFDLLELGLEIINKLKKVANLLVSISPIFNQMDKMHLLFNRTKYLPHYYRDWDLNIYAGLEYAIIQKNCIRIETEDYRRNLDREVLSVALCMGGGDAGNKTLKYLKHLTQCTQATTFWVLLGEGYRHSYDQLVSVIESEKEHEVILAKTNKSMWHILKNCVTIILPGGITTYEAVHAGLPTINTYEKEDQYFLIKELVEQNVSCNVGLSTEENLQQIPHILEHLSENREELINKHVKAKQLIDKSGSERILQVIAQYSS